MTRISPAIFVAAAILGIGQFLAQSGAVRMLPAPTEIFAEWGQLLTSSSYYRHLVSTIFLALSGLVFSILVGVPIGVAMGLSTFVRRGLILWVEGLRSLPAPALIPVIIVAIPSPYGRPTLIGIACAAVMAVATMDGLRATPPERLQFARTVGLKGWRLGVLLLIPSAAERLSVSLRIVVSISLILAVVLEMQLGGLRGAGIFLAANADVNRPAVYAMVFSLGIVGFIANWLVDRTTRFLVFWTD